MLDQLPMGINYAANVGHSALRTWAMGERAFAEQASDEDLEMMRRQLEAALRAGAIGFTTSLTTAHATSDGRPVASRLAAWDEVRALVRVLQEVGHGVFEIAAGAFTSPGAEERYRRIYDLAIESGVPTTFGITPSTRVSRRVLRDMAASVRSGATMFAQTHSRGIQSVLSLKSRLPFDELAGWRELRQRPLPEQLAALRDPVQRRRLIEIANGGDYEGRIGTEPRKPDYDAMTVLERPLPPNPTLGTLAATRGMDPAELMIDLIVESGGDQFFVQPLVPVEQSFLAESMHHPLSVMTFSDSGAHVSQIMDASIHTHFLGYWVRERQEFTLEEAVHTITQRPARAWSFTRRGVLREGMVADVNVFDPERIGPAMPTVEHDLPGGAIRLVQRSEGILATLVAGQPVLLDGEHTGSLPGELLRAGQAHSARTTYASHSH
jgi:N-acyl-D-aspartate/D-glutamate deacylase